MPDGRHKDWARARNPSGDVNITESHPIIKKIVISSPHINCPFNFLTLFDSHIKLFFQVDLNEKSVAGTFTPLDNMDILATAIGRTT
jgi:hypothetical protein